ncbi:TlpA family protein disulfide reductase [Chloroflexota bacterium]
MRSIQKMVALAVLMIMALIMTGCSSGFSPTQGAQVGNPAPDFQLQNLDGQIISLSEFQGKPVLLNFWATWCGPCREEMPYFQEIFEDEAWANRELVILAIDLGESLSEVAGFADNLGLAFPILLDVNQEIGLIYNIRVIPSTFIIDKDGIIIDMKIGAFSSKEEISRRLNNLLPQDE